MDGYWKHYKPSKRFTEKQKNAFASYLMSRCEAEGVDLNDIGESNGVATHGGDEAARNNNKATEARRRVRTLPCRSPPMTRE